MHTTTLFAHYGLTPRPFVRRRPPAAPRRRPLAARERLRAGVPGGWRPALAGVLIALVVGAFGVLRVWPPFAVVMSGSMAPTINTGDLVVLERLRAPARIGDVVAVNVPDEARARYGYPPVVIHRVFRISPDGTIRTKGDARPQPDPFTIPRTAVDRRVVAHIPSGGRVLAFFHSAPGLLWLLFGGALLFGMPLLDRQRDARRREADEAADLRDQLATVAAELGRLQADQEQSRATAAATLSQLNRLVELASCRAPAVTPAAATPVETPTVVVRTPVLASSRATQAPVLAPMARREGTITPVSTPRTPVLATHRPVSSQASASERAGDAAETARSVPGPTRPITHPPLTGRWDAPPCGVASDAGWAAPPVRRFQRSGRLVAASQA